MKAVLDSVVFLRAAINPGSRWGRVLSESGSSYEVIVSPPIVAEILEVLTRSELRVKYPRIDRALLERVLPLVLTARVVEPAETLNVSRDPTADKFFECAVEGRADYIVSEDRDILDVGEYRGVNTVTAAEFLELLSGRAR